LGFPEQGGLGMKKFLLTVLAIIVFSLFSPVTGFSQAEYPNELGVFLNQDGTGPHGVATTVNELVTLYVVLLRPTYVDAPGGPVPYESVTSFEFMLNFDNPDPLYCVDQWLPPGALNFGDDENFHLGYLEYFVGFLSPEPVIDEAIHLVELTFLPVSVSVTEIRISPVNNPSVEGEICYVPGEVAILEFMYPISGSYDAPVFIFNGEAVPVESLSFGSVKSLYR
jgi:hypothetical protein